VMLHQPRDIGVVFQNKNCLAQTALPSSGGRSKQLRRPHGTMNRLLQTGKGIANVV
jgi:hypothetical protein